MRYSECIYERDAKGYNEMKIVKEYKQILNVQFAVISKCMPEMQKTLFTCFRKRSAVKHWSVEGDLKKSSTI